MRYKKIDARPLGLNYFVMHNSSNVKKNSIKYLMTITSDTLSVPLRFLNRTVRSRERDVVDARHISMYFCTVYTHYSLSHIARQYKGSRHTDVIYARKKVLSLMNVNLEFREKFKRVESVLV